MAKNFMSSILDELMGRDRNALPTETPKKMNWDDPDMCTLYLVCFCPHELFVNTKADLGPCTKFHDEQLRKKYLEEAPGFKKSQFETEFIRFAEKMIADIEGKIKRGKMRIALANGPDGGTYAGPGSRNAEKIALLTERINQLLEETEAAGCEGDVEKAQGLMKLCDQLKEERDQLKTAEPVSHPWNPDKAMQVCEVCGSYLIIGEAQHRLDDHIMGKQHVGFAMLRKNLEEVRNAKEARDLAERERLQKERERRFGRSSRDRDGDRRKGDRRSSSKSKSDHGRDRDARRSRDKDRDKDDKDRKRHRSRSRDGKDKGKRRDRSKDDKGRTRHRSRSSDRKDRDRKDRDSKRPHDGKDRDRDRKHSHSKRSRSRSNGRDREGDRHHKRSRSEREGDKREKEVPPDPMDETWDSVEPQQLEQRTSAESAPVSEKEESNLSNLSPPPPNNSTEPEANGESGSHEEGKSVHENNIQSEEGPTPVERLHAQEVAQEEHEHLD